MVSAMPSGFTAPAASGMTRAESAQVSAIGRSAIRVACSDSVDAGLLDLGPRVAEADRTVPHRSAGRGIPEIDAEVAIALELIAAACRGIGETRLEPAARQAL